MSCVTCVLSYIWEIKKPQRLLSSFQLPARQWHQGRRRSQPIKVTPPQRTMPRARAPEESSSQGLSRPPDGGYGWVIVVGCILQWVFTIPVLEMFSFLFAAKFASCQTTPTEQVGRAFDIMSTSKGSFTLPKRMNFRRSSKWPLTPPPSFSESYVAIFFWNSWPKYRL